MRVLVTRPEDDARSLVAALEARGHEALVAPMLIIAPAPGVEAPLDLGGVQALVFTSANGVRVFARLSETRGLPVFAVGDASAAAARDAGFARVESAGGDIEDLARLIVMRLAPGDGALYQAAASRLAGDLKGAIEAAGFTLRREVLYQATPVAELGAALRRELADGGLDAASFFSPRSAETFVSLVEKQGLGEACARITALGLSEAVAAKLRRLAWRAVLVAERPNQEALLARLDDLAGAHSGEETMNRPDADSPDPGAPDAPDAADPGASASARPDAEEATSTGARRIIARFGGIRPMAGKLGVAVSTVQGWRERGAIPPRHHQRLRAAAEAHGVEIDPQDLAGTAQPAQPPGPVAPPPARAEPEPEAEPVPDAKPRAERRPEPETERRPAPAPAPIRLEGGPAAPAPLGAWLGGAVLGALVLALGLGGAVIARDLWMPLVEPEYGVAASGELMEAKLRGDELRGGEITGLERRVAALESAPTSSPSPGDAAAAAETLDRLQRGVAELAGRLETLEAPVERLAALERRVTELLGALATLEGRMDARAGDQPSAARLAELSARIEVLAALEERLDALPELAARSEALAGRVEALAGLAGRVAELPGALAALEGRVSEFPGALAALEQRVAELPGALAALEGRVDALARARAGARGAPSGEAAFTLAVQQLSEVLRGSAPFAEELALLQDLAASGAVEDGAALAREIAPLAAHAETGIPSRAGLEAAFPAVARAVVVQSRRGTEDDWVAGVLGRLSDLVTVRSLGPDGRVEGEDAGAVVARAGDHLEAGDLAEAVAELESLQGPAAEAARSWRGQAAARLAARRVLTGLGRRLLARLEPAGG